MQNSKNAHAKIDTIFDEVGNFGPYQLAIIIICGGLGMIEAINAFSGSFYTSEPNHRCKLPGWELNDTYEIQNDYHKEMIQKYIPPPEDEFLGEYDRCNLKSNESGNVTLESCKSWVYSKMYFKETMISKFDLVCDTQNQGDAEIFETLYFAGTFNTNLQTFLYNFYYTLIYRFGRRTICLIFMTIILLINIMCALATNLLKNYKYIRIVYGLSRLIFGSSEGIYPTSIVLNIETCGSSKHVIAGNSTGIAYVVGMLVVVGVSYFSKDFKYMSLAFTVIISVYFLLFIIIVPESPRWLMIKNKTNEAYKVLARIAKWNKKENLTELQTLVPNTQKILKIDLPEKRKSSYVKTIKSVVKSRKLFVTTLVLLLNWFTLCAVYFGISFNTDRLSGDPYMNFVYSIIAEALSFVAVHFLLNPFGRKLPYALNMGMAGVSLLCIGFVPARLSWIITVLALVAKFNISFTYSAIYIVSAEMYPTRIRNSMVSFCSAFSAIGGLILPQVEKLRESVWFPLPYLIYGSLATVSAILFISFVEETKDKDTPDSIEDVNE